MNFYIKKKLFSIILQPANSILIIIITIILQNLVLQNTKIIDII